MTGLAGLQDVLMGEVIEPGMPGYEAVRRPAMARFWHIRPRAVVRCASADDVAQALALAHRTGLRVVPRGGGHCFAGRSSTDGIVLDMTPLRSISVSLAGAVTIGAGARLAEVHDALHEHSLALPAGCGPAVGIAGLALGGGLGILGRRYGLTCDRLLGAQVVLADGRIVDCDEHCEPELFWALRGAGGGQFGVVTSLVFDPVPAPEATRLELTWPHTDAAAVIAAWQQWAPQAPDGPVTQNLASLPYRDLKGSLAGPGSAEPAQPVISKSEFFRRPLPARSVTELLDTFSQDRASSRVPGTQLHPWAAPTTGCRRRRLASCTARSGSCSSMLRQERTRRAGYSGHGPPRIRGARDGSTRTSPIQTWPTGPRPTTAATTLAWPR